MDIRKINRTDVPFVSKLHTRSLPTAIGRIGDPYLSALYKALTDDPSLHISLLAVHNKKIIGVITATRDIEKTQQQLQRLFFRPTILWCIIRSILRRHVTLAELLCRINFENELRRQFASPHVAILTFFVDKKFQHRGIGTLLLHKLERQFSKRTDLYVDTEITNVRARHWYTTHGFRVRKTIYANVIHVKTLIPAPK